MTNFMDELFHTCSERVLALDGWKRNFNSLACTAQSVVYQVPQIVLFLQLNLPVYVGHASEMGMRLCDPVNLLQLFVEVGDVVNSQSSNSYRRSVYQRLCRYCKSDAAEHGTHGCLSGPVAIS
jgi:hypothetical protein